MERRCQTVQSLVKLTDVGVLSVFDDYMVIDDALAACSRRRCSCTSDSRLCVYIGSGYRARDISDWGAEPVVRGDGRVRLRPPKIGRKIPKFEIIKR